MIHSKTVKMDATTEEKQATSHKEKNEKTTLCNLKRTLSSMQMTQV